MFSFKKDMWSRHWYGWLAGLAALLWLLLKSGTNPKRLTYPCQRAALPVATGWLLATAAFLAGSLFFRRLVRVSGPVLITLGCLWFIGSAPDVGFSIDKDIPALPVWEAADPVSTVYVLDSIPLTPGSLAAGDETVPDEYLFDPAMDTLLSMLAVDGVYLYRTSAHPEGLIGSDNIVIIKGNYQWNGRNTTGTDRVKGLIWRILNHPDGFSGEVIVCDNTQNIGTGFNANDNNSEDTEQCIIDVVGTFSAKGYPVYYLDWRDYYWSVVDEYDAGDYNDGFVYQAATGVTYPKFRTPSLEYYISLRHGVRDSLAGVYDPSRLCIIDFPVLKAHSWAGATVAVKNWIGVVTTAYADDRFGGFNPMHDDYFFGTYALVARVMAVTWPKLTIVDATWTTTTGPSNPTAVIRTDALVAATDPVAASWYAARFILTPVADNPSSTNPDYTWMPYGRNLHAWAAFLSDSAGYQVSLDSSAITVRGRGILDPDTLRCGDANDDGILNLLDVSYLINYLYREGAPPEPLEVADVDSSGAVNILDITYLINYLYRGGPVPVCPW